jgi:hypothetical protein
VHNLSWFVTAVLLSSPNKKSLGLLLMHSTYLLHYNLEHDDNDVYVSCYLSVTLLAEAVWQEQAGLEREGFQYDHCERAESSSNWHCYHPRKNYVPWGKTKSAVRNIRTVWNLTFLLQLTFHVSSCTQICKSKSYLSTCLLGCWAIQSDRTWLTYQMCLLPPSYNFCCH